MSKLAPVARSEEASQKREARIRARKDAVVAARRDARRQQRIADRKAAKANPSEG